MFPKDLQEINVIKKKLRDLHSRMALCFPNTYRAGMSGLTIKLLYHLFNFNENVYCERAFLHEDHTQPIRTLETNTPLKHMDVLCFTFSFELDYINAIKVLLASGIPPEKEKRAQNGKWPLIIAGGLPISANPFPLASIVDGFVIGDVEPINSQFLAAIEQNNWAERKFLLTEIEELFFPSKNQQKSKRVYARSMDSISFPTAQVRFIGPEKSSYAPELDGFFLQVSRGCSNRCDFCLVGRTTGPPRYMGVDRAKELIEGGVRQSKTNKIIFISSAAYPYIKELGGWLIDNDFQCSFPSIRADSDTEVLELLKRVGQRTLTIAPETGDDSLRHAIHKRITNEQIIHFIESARDHKIKKLKLYFMIGLSGMDKIESEAEDAWTLIEQIARVYPKNSLRITASPFIPKVGTPLATHIPDYVLVRSKLRKLSKKCQKLGLEWGAESTRWAPIQALLSLGDESLGRRLIEIARLDGSLGSWRRVIGNPNKYLQNYF